MYSMPRLRSWLTRLVLRGRPVGRGPADPFRFRPIVGELEDRLPPGDYLFTGLAGIAAAAGVADAVGRTADPSAPVARPGRAVSVQDLALSTLPAPRRLPPPPDVPTLTTPRRVGQLPAADLAAVGRGTAADTSWSVRIGAASRGGAFEVGPHAPGVQTTPTVAAPTDGGPAQPRGGQIAPARTNVPRPVTVTGPATPTTPVPETPPKDTATPPKQTPELPFTRTEVVAGIRSADPIGTLARLTRGDTSIGSQIDPAHSRVILTGDDGVALTEVRLAPGADPQAVAKALAAQPWAAFAQPNYVFTGDPRDFTPNDPQYPDPGQYLHTKAQTNLAWDTVTGDPSVTVGIADEGVVYDHPDLAANVWSNPGEVPGDFIDNDSNGFIDDIRGWDFNENDNDPSAGSHGTHVSGIVAARTDNLTGVAGTAGGGNAKGDGARLVPLRWDGPAGWTSTMIANTFAYAADNKIKIVNASYNFDAWVAGGTPLPVVETAFNYSYGKGVLHFNSAGNNGALEAPRAVFTQAMMVASLDKNDIRSSFSNYGKFVDISAHGSEILSTIPGATYGLNSGTSMSTPHAAGAAALIWSKNPTWTREQVVAQLVGTADSVEAANPSIPNSLGAGRVNPFRGVAEALKAPKFGVVSGLPAVGKAGAVSTFTIDTPNLFDSAGVVPASFELRGDGADSTFDTGDDVIVPFTLNAGAPYRIGTDALTFAKVGGGDLDPDRYRFTAFSGATKMRDPFGTALDGDGNGTGGDNFVRIFSTAPSIQGRVYEDFDGAGDRDANDPAVAGRTVFLDVNKNGTFDVGAPFTQTNSTSLAIPDNTTVTSTIVVSGKSGSPIFDLNLQLDITHTYDSDLDIFLVAPNGKRIELTTGNGGSGDNFANTVFDDEASKAVTAGTAPFAGSFRPETPLSVVDGLSPDGTWTLEISDVATQDTGTLKSWSLTFTSAEPTQLTNSSGVYNFFALAPGDYDVRQITPSGWTPSGPAVYTVGIATAETVVLDRDFGTAKNDRYYGFVWEDKNANGLVEVGEPPLPGRKVFEDLNANETFDTATFTETNSTPLLIPDTNTKVFSDITVAGKSGVVQDLNVTIDITHTWDEDLDIFLIAPNGARVDLSTDNGLSGDNYTNTVFDDEASKSITAGTAPFTGSFRPETPLSDLDGLDVNGLWRLELLDDVSSDKGTLNTWSLKFDFGDRVGVTNALGNVTFDLKTGPHTLTSEPPPAGFSFTVPPDGKYTVNAAGAPLYGKYVGISMADATPPTVTAFTVLNGPQRSRVTDLKVEFNEIVQFIGDSKEAFVVTRTPPGGGGTSTVTPTVAIDNTSGKSVVTLTFAAGAPDYGSLPDGTFEVKVLAAKVQDTALNQMAANFTAPTFHRLFGDSDGNGAVSLTDFTAFGSTFGVSVGDPAYLSYMDADANGAVTLTDFVEFGARFGTSV